MLVIGVGVLPICFSIAVFCLVNWTIGKGTNANGCVVDQICWALSDEFFSSYTVEERFVVVGVGVLPSGFSSAEVSRVSRVSITWNCYCHTCVRSSWKPERTHIFTLITQMYKCNKKWLHYRWFHWIICWKQLPHPGFPAIIKLNTSFISYSETVDCELYML